MKKKTLKNFDQNIEKMKKIYKSLKSAHKTELAGVAEEFDSWFLSEFKNSVMRNCNFNGKHFAMTEPEVVDDLVEESVAAARRIIYPRILSYMSEHFTEFYLEGVKLAAANAAIVGETEELKLSDDDKGSIKLQYNTESKVWRSHIEKHRRQLDRELVGAIQARSTVDEFFSRMTAPDKHTVAYPYGNSRISWYEHIRRFLAGRPRMVAATAQMRRRIS